MTYKEIQTMLATLNIPTAYYEFPANTGKEPPFLCFWFPSSDDFYADGQNYAKIRQLRIELYTDAKDFALEASVENLLTANELPFYVEEDFLDSERMHMTVYTTEIDIKEEQANG